MAGKGEQPFTPEIERDASQRKKTTNKSNNRPWPVMQSMVTIASMAGIKPKWTMGRLLGYSSPGINSADYNPEVGSEMTMVES